jgi:hypothetical protein
LLDRQVEFVVIGGLAVGAHGYPRATKDVDIVPDPSPANLERLALLLNDLDYVIIGADEFEPDELVHPDVQGLTEGGSWVLQTRFGRLDILQHVAPDIEYDDLASQAIEDEVFGARIRFCSYPHLIAMKQAAGRDQDLVDLRRLRELRGED